MKISTRGRYGLMAAVDLAMGGGEYKSLREIARSQGLSEAYLEQLMAPLRKAGYVESARGAQGGYRLSRPPGEITAGEILKVLEGPMYPVDCVESGDGAGCGAADCESCATKSLWVRLHDRMNDVLDSVSLEDLVRDYKENDESRGVLL